MLATIPLLGLDYAFERYTEHLARDRLEAGAFGALNMAEGRLREAELAVTELARSGIEACGPRALEAMRLAVFMHTPLKGLSILDDQDRELCTHVGATIDANSVSEEHPVAGKSVFMSAARFRDIDDRAIKLRFEQPSGRSLAALVALDTLLPDPAMQNTEGGRRLKLLFASGELVAVRPKGNEDSRFDEGLLSVNKPSSQYPIVIVAEYGTAALAAEFAGLRRIARGAMLALLILGTGLLWLALKRSRENPVTELEHAIRSGEIIPYYQPTVDTITGRIRGAEVLARWRRSDGVMISPAQFIPLAEQTGLIFDLTRALMKRARDDMGDSYRDRPRLRLGFNLFAGHFTDNRILDDIRKIFDGSPIGLNQLILEVTERTPLPDLDQARLVIETLQKQGVQVAIDDVGTGHGGLSYLLKLGVDIIKIDKLFIDAIGTERYSQTIIELLVELGRTMNMAVIAEGVETVEQVEYLRRKGVTEAQGYVFAPPLPANSYRALIEAMEGRRQGAAPAEAALAAKVA